MRKVKGLQSVELGQGVGNLFEAVVADVQGLEQAEIAHRVWQLLQFVPTKV